MYSEPCQTSKTELFAKIVNGSQPLTIFANASIVDGWLGSECSSDFVNVPKNLRKAIWKNLGPSSSLVKYFIKTMFNVRSRILNVVDVLAFDKKSQWHRFLTSFTSFSFEARNGIAQEVTNLIIDR